MNAQWLTSGNNIYNTNSANVGIGTNTPQFKLHTISASNDWAAKFENQGCQVYLAYGNGPNDGYGQHIKINNNRSDRYAFEIFDGTNELMYVRNDGRIGIGTGTPQFKLHTVSTINNEWTAKFENQGCAVYLVQGNGPNDGYGQHIRINNNRVDRYAFEIFDGTNELLYIRNDGNIGIGTASPAYKLDVIGSIRAREIKVDLNGADFVFEKDYKLMPLNELEKFVNEQKHLPEVAPAKEMKENGTDLGNLNSKLLQKIEELTLYTIEQNKQLEQQNKTIEELKQMMKLQNEKIEKIEAASK
jgi:hypothetical protein